MTGKGLTMRTLFVGGPGRSGTSFVADRLAALDAVVSFRGVELKFFTEKGGLLDLWHSLGEQYSPNRATVAMQQFRKLTAALIDGGFGQPGLSALCPGGDWRALFEGFADALEDHGHPLPASAERFDAAAHALLAGLHDLAARQPDAAAGPRIFLEKTPHALLAGDFLARIAPGAAFLHVMRDPRSIARSLRSMPWGPNDLTQCCAWVDGYCRAWTGWLGSPRSRGLDIRCLHIEDMAGGTDICGWLGLDGAETVFSRADPATLNGWAARCRPEELALLSDRLRGWVAHFGYEADRIGQRPRQATDGQAADLGVGEAPPTQVGSGPDEDPVYIHHVRERVTHPELPDLAAGPDHHEAALAPLQTHGGLAVLVVDPQARSGLPGGSPAFGHR